MSPDTPGPRPTTSPFPIPPDIQEHYRRKRRFETQTPVVGLGCFTILATIGIAVILGPRWYLAIPIAILGAVTTLYRYRAAQRTFTQWEDDLHDWHRGA
jgi:MFS superfamily sulfate permease-like transporter